MKYKIFIKQELVHKTNNIQEAFNVVSSLFRKGHDDVYFYGGTICSWRD
jgi:hypothetical protein